MWAVCVVFALPFGSTSIFELDVIRIIRLLNKSNNVPEVASDAPLHES